MENSTTSHSPDDEKTYNAFDIHVKTTQVQVDSSNPYVDNVGNEVEPLHRPDTPDEYKYIGRPDELNITRNNDSVASHCEIQNIDRFEDYYLRNDIDVENEDCIKPEIDALWHYKGPEAGLHKYAAKLFTRAGLLLCNDSKPAKSRCYNHPDLCSRI